MDFQSVTWGFRRIDLAQAPVVVSGLALEQAGKRRDRALSERTTAPFLERERPARGEVRLKVGFQLRRELALQDGYVDFVVQPERAIVEVGRADHAPGVIDDEDLGVHHRRLVLVD